MIKKPHPERVVAAVAALGWPGKDWHDWSEESTRAGAALAADDAYLAAHPEHVAPEVRAAIILEYEQELAARALDGDDERTPR